MEGYARTRASIPHSKVLVTFFPVYENTRYVSLLPTSAQCWMVARQNGWRGLSLEVPVRLSPVALSGTTQGLAPTRAVCVSPAE
jgi:hypothetical protein